ncbi:DUF4365 domain-containing protein [Nocardioides zeae]|uniref:DUF4365 domain-containing protein n=1 Tax=Nocardioides imazamoxiresistens TaxID=3231893 RepID=A0ABU3PS55_9ACTN|nr:DUF4365 domain-containing protein [Nocardioides zeae]MDT9591615.1 DUF4365 domain-containing protein [Nocardioides zeae]
MTATKGSHTNPEGSLPVNAMREEISKAYIKVLASVTGLTVGEWGQDYDCMDVTLSSGVDYSPDRYGPKIDVQLKCTGRKNATKQNTIAWSLDTRSVAKMSKLNRGTPALLCVMVTAVDYWDWVHLDQTGLLSKSHMYYLWGHDLPALKSSQGHQTVHLPKANLLSPAKVLELMEEASKWQPQTV